jgi:NhaA family Na+:H+ antiporter
MSLRSHHEIAEPWSRSDRLSARVVAQPIQQFMDTEASSGLLLLAAALVAMVWANSPWSASYESFWTTELTVGTEHLHLSEDLRHWVNDLAMAFFFFVVGLEIKRELVHGDLRHRSTAALPVVCALGGMLVPALIYLGFNAGGAGERGWGIPMATDIAFSIGVLALVGRRVPASLKVFLLTLAIVDDIGAILVIALFYSSGVELAWLAAAVGVLVGFLGLHRLGVRSLVPYVVLAAALWLTMFEAGVHATIAGVLLGLLAPARPFQRPETVRRVAAAWLQEEHLADDVDSERDETAMLEVATIATEAVSPVERFGHALHPYTSYLVLPVFALANAGIDLSPPSGAPSITSAVSLGVLVGLVVGKPVGITLAALAAVRFGRVPLPTGAGWVEMVGVGLLAGIGFTVSLFVTGLAFDGPLAVDAKLAILVASAIAGAAGATCLLLRPTEHPLAPPVEPSRDASPTS